MTTTHLPEPNPEVPFQPFRPGTTPEEYARWEAAAPKIAQQQAQCAALQQNMLDAKANYDAIEESTGPAEEAGWQAYSAANEAYNKCLNAVDALVNYRDYGGTMPWNTEVNYEWPKEVPEPESYEHPPAPEPVRPPVASVDTRFQTQTQTQTQAQNQQPTNQSTSSCDTSRGQFIDPVTRQCRGSVATGAAMPNLPGGGATPVTTEAGSSFLQGPIKAAPLMRGRF